MKRFPAHFFVSHDGDLYDLRRERFPVNPLRKGVSHHHQRINNTHELRATLRAGEFAWPGGYQLVFVTTDGEIASFSGVRENYRIVSESIREDLKDGWGVVGVMILDECEFDSDQYCVFTNELLFKHGED